MDIAGYVRKKASTEIKFSGYGHMNSDDEEPTKENRRVIDLMDPVDSIDMNPTRDRAVVAGMRGIIQIIRVNQDEGDVTDGPYITKDENLTTHGRGKINLMFSAQNVRWNQIDANLVATTSTTGAIVVWNLDIKHKSSVKIHDRSATCVDWQSGHPHVFISGSRNCVVKAYDMRLEPDQDCTVFHHGNMEAVRDCAFVKERGYLDYFFSGDDGGIIRLWDMRKPNVCVFEKTAHRSFVSSLSVNQHAGALLATGGGRDRLVKIWEWQKGAMERVGIVETTAPLGRVVWRKDKEYHLATCASVNDPSVHVWDIRRPYIPYLTFEEHRDSVTDACWPSVEQDMFMTCGKDGLVVLHSIDTGHAPVSFACDAAFDIAPDGLMAIALNSDMRNKIENELEPMAAEPGKTAVRKVPEESFRKEIKSFICAGVPDGIKETLENVSFTIFAKKYQLGGRDVEKLCDHNARVARQNEQEHVALTWRLVAFLSEQANLQNTYAEESMINQEQLAKQWRIRKRELMEEGRRWLVNSTEIHRANLRRIFADKLENTQLVTAYSARELMREFRNGDSEDSHSDNDFMDDTDSEDDDDRNIDKDAHFPYRRKLKEQSIAAMDFYFGGEESHFHDTTKKKEKLDCNEFMGLRDEAFELRNFVKDQTLFFDARKKIRKVLTYGKNIKVYYDPKDETSIWCPMLEIFRLLRYHAEQGDIQTCASVAIVCGHKIFDVSDTYTIGAWVESYMEMCDRLGLFVTTARIRKYCPIEKISMISREGTTFNLTHTKCGKSVVNGRCTKCEELMVPECSFCLNPVLGLCWSCYACKHAMHPEHSIQWFATNKKCAQPDCFCFCGESGYPYVDRCYMPNDEVVRRHKKYRRKPRRGPNDKKPPVYVARLDSDNSDSDIDKKGKKEGDKDEPSWEKPWAEHLQLMYEEFQKGQEERQEEFDWEYEGMKAHVIKSVAPEKTEKMDVEEEDYTDEEEDEEEEEGSVSGGTSEYEEECEEEEVVEPTKPTIQVEPPVEEVNKIGKIGESSAESQERIPSVSDYYDSPDMVYQRVIYSEQALARAQERIRGEEERLRMVKKPPIKFYDYSECDDVDSEELDEDGKPVLSGKRMLRMAQAKRLYERTQRPGSAYSTDDDSRPPANFQPSRIQPMVFRSYLPRHTEEDEESVLFDGDDDKPEKDDTYEDIPMGRHIQVFERKRSQMQGTEMAYKEEVKVVEKKEKKAVVKKQEKQVERPVVKKLSSASDWRVKQDDILDALWMEEEKEKEKMEEMESKKELEEEVEVVEEKEVDIPEVQVNDEAVHSVSVEDESIDGSDISDESNAESVSVSLSSDVEDNDVSISELKSDGEYATGSEVDSEEIEEQYEEDEQDDVVYDTEQSPSVFSPIPSEKCETPPPPIPKIKVIIPPPQPPPIPKILQKYIGRKFNIYQFTSEILKDQVTPQFKVRVPKVKPPPVSHGDIKKLKKFRERKRLERRADSEELVFAGRSFDTPCSEFQFSRIRYHSLAQEMKKDDELTIEFIKVFWFIPWKKLLNPEYEHMVREAFYFYENFKKERSQTCKTHYMDFYFKFFVGSLAAKIQLDLVKNVNTDKKYEISTAFTHMKTCISSFDNPDQSLEEMIGLEAIKNPDWNRQEKTAAKKYWNLFGNIPIDVKSRDNYVVANISDDTVQYVEKESTINKEYIHMMRRKYYNMLRRSVPVRLRVAKQFVNQKKKEVEAHRKNKRLDDDLRKRVIKFTNETSTGEWEDLAIKYDATTNMIQTDELSIPYPIVQFQKKRSIITIQPIVNPQFVKLKNRLRKRFLPRPPHRFFSYTTLKDGSRLKLLHVKNDVENRYGTVQRLYEDSPLTRNGYNLIVDSGSFKRWQVSSLRNAKYSNMYNKVTMYNTSLDIAFSERVLGPIVEETQSQVFWENIRAKSRCSNNAFLNGKVNGNEEQAAVKLREMEAKGFKKWANDRTECDKQRTRILRRRWLPEFNEKVAIARKVLRWGKELMEYDAHLWMVYRYKLYMSKMKRRYERSRGTSEQGLNELPDALEVTEKEFKTLQRRALNLNETIENGMNEFEYNDNDDLVRTRRVSLTDPSTCPPTPSDDDSISTWYANEDDMIVEKFANAEYIDEMRIIVERTKGPLARDVFVNDESSEDSEEEMTRESEKLFKNKNKRRIVRKEERKRNYRFNKELTNMPMEYNDDFRQVIVSMHSAEIRRVSNRLRKQMKEEYQETHIRDTEITEQFPIFSHQDLSKLFYELLSFKSAEDDNLDREKDPEIIGNIMGAVGLYELIFDGYGVFSIQGLHIEFYKNHHIRDCVGQIFRNNPTKRKLNLFQIYDLASVWFKHSPHTFSVFMERVKYNYLSMFTEPLEESFLRRLDLKNIDALIDTYDKLIIGDIVNIMVDEIDVYIYETKEIIETTNDVELALVLSDMSYEEWYKWKHRKEIDKYIDTEFMGVPAPYGYYIGEDANYLSSTTSSGEESHAARKEFMYHLKHLPPTPENEKYGLRLGSLSRCESFSSGGGRKKMDEKELVELLRVIGFKPNGEPLTPSDWSDTSDEENKQVDKEEEDDDDPDKDLDDSDVDLTMFGLKERSYHIYDKTEKDLEEDEELEKEAMRKLELEALQDDLSEDELMEEMEIKPSRRHNVVQASRIRRKGYEQKIKKILEKKYKRKRTRSLDRDYYPSSPDLNSFRLSDLPSSTAISELSFESSPSPPPKPPTICKAPPSVSSDESSSSHRCSTRSPTHPIPILIPINEPSPKSSVSNSLGYPIIPNRTASFQIGSWESDLPNSVSLPTIPPTPPPAPPSDEPIVVTRRFRKTRRARNERKKKRKKVKKPLFPFPIWPVDPVQSRSNSPVHRIPVGMINPPIRTPPTQFRRRVPKRRHSFETTHRNNKKLLEEVNARLKWNDYMTEEMRLYDQDRKLIPYVPNGEEIFGEESLTKTEAELRPLMTQALIYIKTEMENQAIYNLMGKKNERWWRTTGKPLLNWKKYSHKEKEEDKVDKEEEEDTDNETKESDGQVIEVVRKKVLKPRKEKKKEEKFWTIEAIREKLGIVPIRPLQPILMEGEVNMTRADLNNRDEKLEDANPRLFPALLKIPPKLEIDIVDAEKIRDEIEIDACQKFDDDAISYSSMQHCHDYELYYQRERPEHRLISCIVNFTPQQFFDEEWDSYERVKARYQQMIDLTTSAQTFVQFVKRQRLFKMCRDVGQKLLLDEAFGNKHPDVPTLLQVLQKCLITFFVDFKMEIFHIRIVQYGKIKRKSVNEKVMDLRRNAIINSNRNFKAWMLHEKVDMEVLMNVPVLWNKSDDISISDVDSVADIAFDAKVLEKWNSVWRDEGISALDTVIRMKAQSPERVALMKEIFKPIYEQWYDDWRIQTIREPRGYSFISEESDQDKFFEKKRIVTNYAYQYYRMLKYDPMMASMQEKDATALPHFRNDVPSGALLNSLKKFILDFADNDAKILGPEKQKEVKQRLISISLTGNPHLDVKKKSKKKKVDPDDDVVDGSSCRLSNERVLEEIEGMHKHYQEKEKVHREFMLHNLFKIAEKIMYKYMPTFANFKCANTRFKELMTMHYKTLPMLDVILNELPDLWTKREDELKLLKEMRLVTDDEIKTSREEHEIIGGKWTPEMQSVLVEIVQILKESEREGKTDRIKRMIANKLLRLKNLHENGGSTENLKIEDKKEVKKIERRAKFADNEDLVVEEDDMLSDGSENLETADPSDLRKAVRDLRKLEEASDFQRRLQQSAVMSLAARDTVMPDDFIHYSDRKKKEMELKQRQLTDWYNTKMTPEALVEMQIRLDQRYEILGKVDRASMEALMDTEEQRKYLDMITIEINKRKKVVHESWRRDVPPPISGWRPIKKYDPKDPETSGKKWF